MAANEAFRARRRSFSLTFFDQIRCVVGGNACRPPTVFGAWAPIIVPRIRGVRAAPRPLPGHRTEWRIPARNFAAYGWRRFAWNATTARRMRSTRTSPANTGGRSTVPTDAPEVSYRWT